MAPKKKRDPKLVRAGVSGYNKPKRTPNHPKKSHVVVAKVGNKTKLIRFGQQGVRTAGKPKKGESARQKARRKSFKARHAKNIAKGKMSAAYWAIKLNGKLYIHRASKLLWAPAKGHCSTGYLSQVPTWEPQYGDINI